MTNTQTLILDQGYQPYQVVPWQQAITMLFQKKARLVEAYDKFVRSAHEVHPVPAVVSLKERVKRDKKPVKFSRVNVYSRDSYTCQYCGTRCTAHELTYDHVIPRSHGGRTIWTNIVSCCYPCNEQKGGRTPQQAGMRLLSHPVQPNDIPRSHMRLRKEDSPTQWHAYLRD